MRLNILHWLTLAIVILAEAGNAEEPDEVAGRWELRTDRRHWHAAALACRRAGGGGEGEADGGGGDGGGRLAVPRSQEEARAMGRLIVAAFPDPTDGPWAFVGLNDLAEEGEFATEDGESLWNTGYARWHSWDSHGGPDDHCVALDRFGLFWDVPCDWHLPFLCAPPPPPPPPPSCSSTIEYTKVYPSSADSFADQQPEESSSYSLEREPRNWWAAAAECARAGRRLAMPRTRFEAAALRDLLTAAEHDEMAGGAWPLAFIGVSDLARAGRPRTLLGEPFGQNASERWRNVSESNEDEDEDIQDQAETLYTPLEGSEDPPEVVGGSTCMAVNSRALYQFTRCTTPLPFFCERSPPAGPPPAPCPPPTSPPPPNPDELPPPPDHFWLRSAGAANGGGVTWDQAARECLDGKGVLAVPETAGEARAMAYLLRQIQRVSDAEIGTDIWAYVGVRDFSQDGNFSTIFGDNASVAARGAEWGPGQPNGDGEQPCVVLDRAATLWDVPCTWRLGFFCRRFPTPPPWTATTNARRWRSNSQAMHRWLSDMTALGAGTALREGEEAAEAGGEGQHLLESARGFARVDLRAWIDSFRYGSLGNYAPFDFTGTPPPYTVRA